MKSRNHRFRRQEKPDCLSAKVPAGGRETTGLAEVHTSLAIYLLLGYIFPSYKILLLITNCIDPRTGHLAMKIFRYNELVFFYSLLVLMPGSEERFPATIRYYSAGRSAPGILIDRLFYLYWLTRAKSVRLI
jgi:hypothetical protein